MEHAFEQAKAQYESIAAMVEALEEAYNGNSSEEDVREAIQEAIQEDPISVEVRTGWYYPGQTPEAEEFRILLCTGGPAVQIRGELDYNNNPRRAWLEYQDWGTSWTQYFDADQETLLTYCRQFYFGE